MKSISDRGGVLIEVAAQHPLDNGMFPNEEFSARLELAAKLYKQLKTEDRQVKIFVPGSIHKGDKISLSMAGEYWLLDLGVPSTDVLSEGVNVVYKPTGVYNSIDECYVACCLFDDLGYGELHCVCSPAQVMRKALGYIEYGRIPQFHTAPVADMFHNYIEELFVNIPKVLNNEWDAEAEILRKERKV
jgi:hypothetical protein